MDLYSNDNYLYDIHGVSELNLPWEKLQDKTILISGATGLIGSFLIDVIMDKNVGEGLNCTVFALGRNKERFLKRFIRFALDNHLVFLEYDINLPLDFGNAVGKVDYVLHLASNTHPFLYSTDPIGTITTNIIGVLNMLDFAVEHKTTRFAFASSNEIYGENRGDKDIFDENYCGYINCNSLRAGYPESKRCGEALCQAYKAQKGLDFVIPRITRSYGPTMSMSDTKAISQFIKKGMSNERIVLKSEGNQIYSYTYVADAVSGLLYVLLCGESGNAYNIADEKQDVRLKEIAEIVARISGTEVVFEIPDAVEAAGYSVVTKARLDGTKIKALGWDSRYDIRTGIKRTIDILKALQ